MKTYHIIIALLICFGCQTEKDINMKPVSAFKISKSVVEEGDSVAFTCMSYDKDGEISKREWVFGNGNTSEEMNPKVTFDAVGEYKVYLTVWDNMGQQNPVEFSKTILVKEKSLSDVQPEIIWNYKTPAGFQATAPAIDSKGNIVIGCEGKPGRPGGTSSVLLINKGNLVWEFGSTEIVRSSAAISDDDIIYIGSYDRKLYSFNALSGTPLASYNIVGQAKYSSPAIDKDGIVYFSSDKKLYAISPAPEMKGLWTFNCEGTTQSTPVILESVIYIASDAGYLYAINKDGSLKWKTKYGKTCSSIPAVGKDGTIYLCGENDAKEGVVVAISSNGTVLWEKNFKTDFITSGIILSDNSLYVGGGNGELTSMSMITGEINWLFKTSGKIISTPAIDNHGNIYIGDDKGMFYVLNKDGKQRYKELKLGTKIWSSPAIASDGTIYICSDLEKSTDPGMLYAIKTIATHPFDSWSMRSGGATRNGRAEK